MRIFKILILSSFLSVIACSKTNDNKDHTINLYGFIDQVLRDTSIVRNTNDSVFVIADVSSLPAPLFKGREIDFVSKALQESDSIFLKGQFKARREFRTDSLSFYGFRIFKVSELPELSSDSIWAYVYKRYGAGYYSVSRPIFNKSYDKAYLKVGYSCGSLCGYGGSYLIEKADDKWLVTETLGFWEN